MCMFVTLRVLLRLLVIQRGRRLSLKLIKDNLLTYLLTFSFILFARQRLKQ